MWSSIFSWIWSDVQKNDGWIWSFWNSCKNFFSYKTIAVIGITASGKNCFFNKLARKEFETEYNQTRGSEWVEDFTVEANLPNGESINFNCSHCQNIGGEVDERERFWLESCKNAEFIFYLVDITRFDGNDIRRRIYDDFEWIADNLFKLKKGAKLYIFLNKIDTIEPEKREETFSRVKNDVQKLVNEILGLNKNYIIGIGKMSTKRGFDNYFSNALAEIYQKVNAD